LLEGLSARTLGTAGVRVGSGCFQNCSSSWPWPKISPLNPHTVHRICRGGISHQSRCIPRPPSWGKLNTTVEDFRSSTSPKPTAVPFASLSWVCSPLSAEWSLPGSRIPRGIPGPQPRHGNTVGLCSGRWEPAAAPRGCPASRFTAEVPARLFITTLSCFTARAQQTALPPPRCSLRRPFPISSEIFHHFKGNKVSSEGKRKLAPRAMGFEIVRGVFDGLPGQAPGPGSLQITPRGRKHAQPL